MCEIGSCLIVIKIPAITERSYWSVELRFKNEISTKMERLKSVPFLLHFHCLNRQWRKTSELAICLQSNVLQIVINDVSLNLTFKKYIYHQLVPALDDGPTFFVAVEGGLPADPRFQWGIDPYSHYLLYRDWSLGLVFWASGLIPQGTNWEMGTNVITPLHSFIYFRDQSLKSKGTNPLWA